jgi:hypothetical protein
MHSLWFLYKRGRFATSAVLAEERKAKGFVRPLGSRSSSINHSFLAFMKALIHRKDKYVGKKGQLYFTL